MKTIYYIGLGGEIKNALIMPSNKISDESFGVYLNDPKRILFKV